MKIILLFVLIFSSTYEVVVHLPQTRDTDKVTITISDLGPTSLSIGHNKHMTVNAVTIGFSRNLFGDPEHPEEEGVIPNAAKLGDRLLKEFSKEDIVANAQIVILDDKLYLITDRGQNPGDQVRWLLKVIQRIYGIKLVSDKDILEASLQKPRFFL